MNNTMINIPETESFEESKNVLESIFNEFAGAENDELGIGSILSILMLPEQEFALLNEQVLNELEKSLNSVEDKTAMVQALNAGGMKADDFTKIFIQLNDEIEKNFAGKFSQQKIDFLKRFFGIITEAINATEGIAKRVVPVAVAYTDKDATFPKYAHAGDAGLDIVALEDYVIKPGETVLIKTGLKVALPLGHELQVRPRSGQSLKTKIRVANSPGTIDSNYRDEIGVIVENIEPRIQDIETAPKFDDKGNIIGLNLLSVEYGKDYIIEKGQRFAQLVLSEVPYCMFYEVEELDKIEGGRDGGFGSSGRI